MVGAVHDERELGGEGAELTDDQACRTVVVQNVSGFELVRELGVVVVAELPNLDQRAGDQGLEKHYSRLARDRVQLHGIGCGACFHGTSPRFKFSTRACHLPDKPVPYTERPTGKGTHLRTTCSSCLDGFPQDSPEKMPGEGGLTGDTLGAGEPIGCAECRSRP